MNYEILKGLLVSGKSMEAIEEDWLCGLSYTELKDLEIKVKEKPLVATTDEEMNPYNRTPVDIVWCQRMVKEEI